MASELPRRIGKYELQEFLGGGMAHVYRAQDTVLGRTVALKIMTESAVADDEAKARFLQEARMAGNVVHENVISLFDFGEESGCPFIVMEFLSGKSLRDAIRDGVLPDLNAKLDVARQVAGALDYIHQKKIIHRDVKPENIHLDPSGKVKLMDFGIAKAEGLQLTRAGFTLGTPYYMAPEQVMGQQMTPLVDVYAFGILLFEMLAGVKPIQSTTVDKIFNEILYEPLNVEPLKPLDLPPRLMNLIVRCTAKAPAERPQSFAEVCEELRRLHEEPTNSSLPAAQETPGWIAKLPAPLQSPAALTALAAVVVLGILASLYGLIRLLMQ